MAELGSSSRPAEIELRRRRAVPEMLSVKQSKINAFMFLGAVLGAVLALV